MTLRELLGFLGLTKYYQKFLAWYASIADPLTEQLKKDSFRWTLASTSFNHLKSAMTTTPILLMCNF